MNDLFENLDNLIDSLKEAFAKEDWSEVAQLDLSVQHIVGATEKRLMSADDRSAFHKRVIVLQALYEHLSQENLSRKQALSSELKKLHKKHSAISQYLQSSSYQ